MLQLHASCLYTNKSASPPAAAHRPLSSMSGKRLRPWVVKIDDTEAEVAKVPVLADTATATVTSAAVTRQCCDESSELLKLKAEIAELKAQLRIKDAALAALDGVCRLLQAEAIASAANAAEVAPVPSVSVAAAPVLPVRIKVQRAFGKVGRGPGQLQYPM